MQAISRLTKVTNVLKNFSRHFFSTTVIKLAADSMTEDGIPLEKF